MRRLVQRTDVSELSLRPAAADDLDDVAALLAVNDLPHEDVHDGDGEFYLAVDDGTLVGVAGLEQCGEDALLRSVVVRERLRGCGYGSALVAAIDDRARERGTERLYLLTTTAARFFADEGFQRVTRTEVPEAVRSTTEFAELCPDSATAMVREL